LSIATVPEHPPRTTPNKAQKSKSRQVKKSRGRPRNPGPRYANGVLKKPTRAQKARAAQSAQAALAEKLTVIRQPHRRGDDDRLLESPLGRIIIKHNASRELFAVGCAVGKLVRAWSAAVGAPAPIFPAAHLTVREKKGRARQAEFWVVTGYDKVEMRLREPVVDRWDYKPWVDHAAMRASKADNLAKRDNKKLQRLRHPLDNAYNVMLSAAQSMRPALRYPAMVLDRVRTVVVDERDLNDPKDEPYVIAALLALRDSGMSLSRDGPSPEQGAAMKQYKIRLGIYRAAFGVA
jgi:hypothetical protein